MLITSSQEILENKFAKIRSIRVEVLQVTLVGSADASFKLCYFLEHQQMQTALFP